MAATILPVASALAQIGNSYADLVEKLQPSVVNISTTNLLSEETEEQDENLGIISKSTCLEINSFSSELNPLPSLSLSI